MKQTSFSPEESIRLINEMINDARQSYELQSFFFLLWGWLLFLTGVGVFILSTYNQPYADLLWFMQGVAGGITAIIYSLMQGKKVRESRKVSSPVNKTFKSVWIAFGITLFFIIFSAAHSGIDPIPFILLVTAFPTFISGKILKFKAFVAGSICFWASGIAALFIPYPDNSLIFSFAILAGYLIPGYLLKRKEKTNTSVQRS